MGFNKKFFTTGGIVASTPPAAAAGLDPLQNFETVTYTGNGGTQKITGYIRKGAAFDGSSSNFYISGSEVIDFTSKDYTISLFVNLSSNATDQVLISSWNNTTRRFQLVTTSSNRFIIYERNSSNTTQTHTLNYTYSTNTWYHIGIVRNSTQILFYVNGSLEQTVSANYSIYSSGSNDLWFGKQENSTAPASCYNGKLDQIRLFNTGLDSSKISELALEEYGDSTVSTTDFGGYGGIALYQLDGNANDTGGTYNGTANDITYKYDGIATNVNFLGMAFQPDLVWIKNRDSSLYSHRLFDSVRGADITLSTNNTNAEYNGGGTGYMSSFDSNGFTLSSSNVNTNNNGTDYVAWCWKAADTTTSYSASSGVLASDVRANQEAGFSIVTWTADSSTDGLINHGLSSAPELVIYKNRNNFTAGWGDWFVLTTVIDGSKDALVLNSTAAAVDVGTAITLDSTYISNWQYPTSNTLVAYCFHSVDGYQRVSTYTGSGSSGKRVYTTDDGTSTGNGGFRPRWVMVKATTGLAYQRWYIEDSTRGGGQVLYANESFAEASYTSMSFNDDGFTLNTTDGGVNAASTTFIYLAIA